LKHVLSTCDIVRIDHFRGFSAYWEVPAGEKTAIHGSWVAAPGQKLFDHLHKVFGAQMPVIAEDLGVITPDVEELRGRQWHPWHEKWLQFAFWPRGTGRLDSTNAYLPHNCTERSVIYTGTHDNNTTQGWYDTLDGAVKDKVRRYLECPDDQVVWQMVRAALMSVCQDAIFPMQDWLGLGADAGMTRACHLWDEQLGPGVWTAWMFLPGGSIVCATMVDLLRSPAQPARETYDTSSCFERMPEGN
jgi:4-alpha-glucanotransferase